MKKEEEICVSDITNAQNLIIEVLYKNKIPSGIAAVACLDLGIHIASTSVKNPDKQAFEEFKMIIMHMIEKSKIFWESEKNGQ